MSVHIQSVNRQILRAHLQTLKHLTEGQIFTVAMNHHRVGLHTHLLLDKAQQVFLIHRCRVVHMIVDFAHIVEIAMRHVLLLGGLAKVVQKQLNPSD